MIVARAPGLRRVVAEVWRPLAALFVWDVVVTVAWHLLPFRAPPLPLTLFGSALALFLGFRSNSAYARWWEGRVLWGAMINASRSLARAARNHLAQPDARGDVPHDRDRPAPGDRRRRPRAARADSRRAVVGGGSRPMKSSFAGQQS